MDDAFPSRSPSGHLGDFSDERLAVELRKCSDRHAARPFADVLLERHWEAVFSYARLYVRDARAAGILATAAFTRLFEESLRQAEPMAAWRLPLLVGVRCTEGEWQADERRQLLNSQVPSSVEHGADGSPRFMPPQERRQLAQAFRRLPEQSRCLLWHTEVEADSLGIPAELLGLPPEEALVELEWARQRLRQLFLDVHRESAPQQECRHYNRMLDVTFRRGGVSIDRDLRGHLEGCSHCRRAAHELECFNGSLALSLAEAVLGWSAQAYLATRPGRGGRVVDMGPPVPVTLVEEGEAAEGADPVVAFSATGPRASARRAVHSARRRRNLALATAAVGALVLGALALWVIPNGSRGSANDRDLPSAASSSGSTPGGEWIGDGSASSSRQGLLRNAGNDLCVGTVGKKHVVGVGARLVDCVSANGQQWSLGSDGLLRDVAAPSLCLDSHLGYSVMLAPCTRSSRAEEVNLRFDITPSGAILPHSNPGLALAPAAARGTSDLVLKPKDDSAAQHWSFDASDTSPSMKRVGWDAEGDELTVTEAAPSSSATAYVEPTGSATEASALPSVSASAASAETSCSYCSDDGQHNGGRGHGRGGH